MFVRFKPSVQGGQTYEYLQLVESYRKAGHVRQRVRATLGRRDQLVASGALDDLLQSLAGFSDRQCVAERVRIEDLQAHQAKPWGPAAVFSRLWEQQGLPGILQALTADRRLGFHVERAGFALALQRLCAPGSDGRGAAWLQTVEAPGVIGALLRREGLYASHLTKWRAQRERGELASLPPKKRGPAPKPKNPWADKVAALERAVSRLTARAERTEALAAGPPGLAARGTGAGPGPAPRRAVCGPAAGRGVRYPPR